MPNENGRGFESESLQEVDKVHKTEQESGGCIQPPGTVAHCSPGSATAKCTRVCEIESAEHRLADTERMYACARRDTIFPDTAVWTGSYVSFLRLRGGVTAAFNACRGTEC